MALIEVQDVSKLYGFGDATTLALDEVSFMAASREALTLVEHDWALIESVANALLNERRLGFEQVLDIVMECDSRGASNDIRS